MGKSCHIHSASTPRYLLKFLPPPTTKFPPELAKLLRSPCGKPTPPPKLKFHLWYSCPWTMLAVARPSSAAKESCSNLRLLERTASNSPNREKVTLPAKGSVRVKEDDVSWSASCLCICSIPPEMNLAKTCTPIEM